MEDYKELYKKKLVLAEEIVDEMQPGWNCCTDIGGSIPKGILNAVGKRAKEGKIRQLSIHSLLDLEPMECFEVDKEWIRPVSWFSGNGLRKAVMEGNADIMPCCYSDIPKLMTEYVTEDAFLAVVSPMDKHGYFSMGVVGSNSDAHIRNAKHIYLEVNKYMPRSTGASIVHISQVEKLCEYHVPLAESKPIEIDDISRKIGGLIAEEVADGSTLQLGIGAIPEAVGYALKDKKHLGIHTELFSDSMVELIECGAVDNSQKRIHPGKTVTTFVYGSRRTYNFIDDNPSVLILPVDFVNKPAVIAQNPKFISVNSALEVDFFGQVCAESVGTKHVSGTGGQLDYVRGAVQSEGGKSFIAFPSTAKNGSVSRIKATLTQGAVVTTGKNDVDCIVTEYGIAKLRGATLSERCRRLISVAHPKFREELLYQAKKQNIL